MTTFEERCDHEDEADRLARVALEDAHERGFEAGYSAAIHDGRTPGSRAHAELQRVRCSHPGCSYIGTPEQVAAHEARP